METSSKPIKYATLAIKTFIIIFLLWSTVLFINWCYKVVTIDIQLDYGEGEILNFSYLLSKGEGVYRYVNGYPLLFCNYPPVFILLCSIFMNEDFSLIPGRIISLMALFIILLIVFLIVKHESKSLYLSIMASFIVIYFYPIFFWAPFCRIDIFGTAFSFLGFWFVVKYKDSNLKYLSIVFFLISLYTKQTLIAAPIAAYLYLFLKNRRQGLICIFSLAISGLIIFILMSILTGGAFYYNLITYNNRDFFWDRFFASWTETVLPFYPVFLAFSLFYVFLTLVERKNSPITFYFITSVLITILTGGTGADLNFFIEFFILVSIATALLFSHINKIWNGKEKSLVLLLCYFLIISQFIAKGTRLFPEPPEPDQINQDKAMVEIFKSSEKNILADNLTNILRSGKPVLLHPFVFNYLARGRWDKEIFLSHIEKGNFSLIELPAGKENEYPEEFKTLLLKNYKIEWQFQYYHKYKGMVSEYIYVYQKGNKE